MKFNSDQEIIDGFRDKSLKDAAFSALVEQYHERIYWHIRKMVIDHELANDVCQNTFIKIWKNLDKFRSDSKLYTWIYRIATNESIDQLKKEKKRRGISVEESEEEFGMTLKADPYFNGSEMELMLQQAINTLPEKQKIVFNMRYFEEMKYDEMSEILETSVGALKASYHHAAKKVEEFLKNGLNL